MDILHGRIPYSYFVLVPAHHGRHHPCLPVRSNDSRINSRAAGALAAFFSPAGRPLNRTHPRQANQRPSQAGGRWGTPAPDRASATASQRGRCDEFVGSQAGWLEL